MQVPEVLLQDLPKKDCKRHKHECSHVAAAVARRSKNEVYYGFMDADTFWRWQEVMDSNYQWEEFDGDAFEIIGVRGSTSSRSSTG